MLEIQRLKSFEGERWRSIRLAALRDAPDAFGTTLAEATAFPPEIWSRQVVKFSTFIAVLDGVDVVRDWAGADGFSQLILDVADANLSAIALYPRKGFVPTGETGTLPAPRQDIREHRRALTLTQPQQ
jgi:hypothetical protein